MRSTGHPSYSDRSMPRSPWVRSFSPRPDPRLRLWCLPHAGGSASMFRDWPGGLPGAVEVGASQLPGREDRIAEPAVDDAAELADQLWQHVGPHLDRPYALFGHSMGALIAFELARRARAAGAEPLRF